MVKSFDINEIATQLNELECTVHGKTATITVKGNDLNFENVCCSDFFTQLNSAYKNKVDEQIKLRINNLLKKH